MAAGSFVIVEMLYSSDLLAIVGAGEQTTTGSPLRELNFLTSILAVFMNKKRLVVVLLEKTFVYDLNSLVMLDTIDTVPNPKGLFVFSPSIEGCYLAVPASATKGSVLVYNVMDLQSHSEIDAHCSPLAAIALSSNGMYIATATEQGTLIRVHLVSEATKSYSFRRGTYPSTIYSVFGTINTASGYISCNEYFRLHSCLLFNVGHKPKVGIKNHTLTSLTHCEILNSFQSLLRSKRSTSFLGSVLPDSVSDALDPAHHHVLQNAVSSRIRSYAVVRKIEKLE